jgi:hypothetical protein
MEWLELAQFCAPREEGIQKPGNQEQALNQPTSAGLPGF